MNLWVSYLRLFLHDLLHVPLLRVDLLGDFILLPKGEILLLEIKIIGFQYMPEIRTKDLSPTGLPLLPDATYKTQLQIKHI